MKILNLYLTFSFWRSFLLMGAILGLLFGFFDFLKQLDAVGRGSFTITKALLFVILTSGSRIYALLPIISLLAALASLGSLADKNEILAMQAAGMSRAKIGGVVVAALGVFLGLMLLAEEFFFPRVEHWAWLLRARALSTKDVTPYEGGFWAKSGPSYIKVETVHGKDFLLGIEIFTFDQQGRLKKFIEASRGRALDNQWLLEKVIVREFLAGEIKEKRFPKLRLKAFLKINQVEMLTLPPDFLSIRQLMHYQSLLKEGGQNYYRYALLIWRKIASPVTSWAMLLLALGFVFGPTRERGMGFRLSLGMLFGLLVYLGQEILSHVGLVFNLSAPLVSLLPSILVFLLALFRLSKIE